MKPRATCAAAIALAVLLALPACSADTPVPAPARPAPAGAEGPAASAGATGGGACGELERTVFACSSAEKHIALCEVSARDARPAALQYRIARTGSPPEMVYPGPGDASPAFSTGTKTLAGGGGAWIEFTRASYRYVVFSFWLQGSGETAGVAVEQGGKRQATLHCQAGAQSELGPDYFETAQIPASNADFLP